MKNSQGIEGVPVGVKVVSVWSRLRKGQGRVSPDGTIEEIDPVVGGTFGVVVEPDNVYGMLDLYAIPIPKGYRRKGDSPEEWFRVPGKGDWIVFDLIWRAIQITQIDLCYMRGEGDCRRIIIEPIPKKRVLVVEHELGEKEFPTDVGFFNPRDGNPASWVPVPKNKWRIEERDA